MQNVLESIHRFFVKRPVLALVVFVFACLGTCLVPLVGVPLVNQIHNIREQGMATVLVSLLTLLCILTSSVLIARSPQRPSLSPHEVLIALGFTRKAKSDQLPTYLHTVSGRQMTAYYPVNNTSLTLDIACSSPVIVTIWSGKAPAIAVPVNWLLGRRRVTGDSMPDDVTCMAKETRWGKSLLENQQARSLVLRLLKNADLAATPGITINHKSISLTLGAFQEGATITPNKLQQWIEDLVALAEIVEKQSSLF